MYPTGGFLTPIGQLLASALGIINGVLIPLLIAVAICFFFWGLIQYIRGAGGEGGHKQGINTMVAGIIAILIMVSLWGIIHLVAATFNISTTSPFIQAPQVH